MNFNDIISKIIDKIPLKENESLTINAEYSYPLTAALEKFRSGKPNIDCRRNKMDEQLFHEIAKQIEAEYNMGGLSGGLYEEYARDILIRYLEKTLPEGAKDTEQQLKQ